jgi:hypothetical protein
VIVQVSVTAPLSSQYEQTGGGTGRAIVSRYAYQCSFARGFPVACSASFRRQAPTNPELRADASGSAVRREKMDGMA